MSETILWPPSLNKSVETQQIDDTLSRRKRMRRAPEADGCPSCGSTDIGFGYGFACGPGVGAYNFCNSCGETISKVQDNG